MYDYVIVGGGSAGCVLANRLSADPSVSVCLLEAGPTDSSPFIRLPIGIVYMMVSKKLNWQYYTEPQVNLNGRRLYWPRGKTLGGSSSSNAMIYTRGHPSDYDQWAALGNAGWSYNDVLPFFRLAQHHEPHAAGLGATPSGTMHHGVGGPLDVATLRTPNVLTGVFIAAGIEAGYTRNDDFNGPVQEGVGQYHVTQKNGERWSVARAYLHPVLHRPNLTVTTGARATKVILKGHRATGVDFIRAGKPSTVTARREVILSGGAINSPQLLLLSGIGPPDELARHGIPVRHALPGVGKNLQDHLDVLLVHRCSLPVTLGISAHNLFGQHRHLMHYLRSREGPLTTNSAEGGGFIRSRPELSVPDLQLHFTPARLTGHARNLSSAAATLFGHGYALHVCDLRPRSRGVISLRSADPLADALIDPAYLSDPSDVDTLVRGVHVARAILRAKAFDAYRGKELFPGEQVQSDEDIRAFIRARAETIYHPMGSCKMGHDPMAVVNSALQVHGIEGLRVVDASIMPTLVGGNTNAPTVMIAEKAAAMILAGTDGVQTSTSGGDVSKINAVACG